MRRWYVPLTVLGFASLGVLVLTQRGRQALRWLAENFEDAPDTLLQWNEATQRELEADSMLLVAWLHDSFTISPVFTG